MYAWVFGSLHPGGAQFVFSDGNTRLISEDADYELFCRLNYIHDGEPIADFVGECAEIVRGVAADWTFETCLPRGQRR